MVKISFMFCMFCAANRASAIRLLDQPISPAAPTPSAVLEQAQSVIIERRKQLMPKLQREADTEKCEVACMMGIVIEAVTLFIHLTVKRVCGYLGFLVFTVMGLIVLMVDNDFSLEQAVSVLSQQATTVGYGNLHPHIFGLKMFHSLSALLGVMSAQPIFLIPAKLALRLVYRLIHYINPYNVYGFEEEKSRVSKQITLKQVAKAVTSLTRKVDDLSKHKNLSRPVDENLAKTLGDLLQKVEDLDHKTADLKRALEPAPDAIVDLDASEDGSIVEIKAVDLDGSENGDGPSFGRRETDNMLPFGRQHRNVAAFSDTDGSKTDGSKTDASVGTAVTDQRARDLDVKLDPPRDANVDPTASASIVEINPFNINPFNPDASALWSVDLDASGSREIRAASPIGSDEDGGVFGRQNAVNDKGVTNHKGVANHKGVTNYKEVTDYKDEWRKGDLDPLSAIRSRSSIHTAFTEMDEEDARPNANTAHHGRHAEVHDDQIGAKSLARQYNPSIDTKTGMEAVIHAMPYAILALLSQFWAVTNHFRTSNATVTDQDTLNSMGSVRWDNETSPNRTSLYIDHGEPKALKAFVDAFYMNAITATTIGYGDIMPPTPKTENPNHALEIAKAMWHFFWMTLMTEFFQSNAIHGSAAVELLNKPFWYLPWEEAKRCAPSKPTAKRFWENE